MYLFAKKIKIWQILQGNNLSSKRGMRRSADALKAPTYIEDTNSGELCRPHHIDLKTGMYCGGFVLPPED